MNRGNHYLIYDFETGGKNPLVCEPIEIAAIVLHYKTLEPIQGGQFHSLMKPLFPDKLEDEALAVNHKTREMLIKAPHPKQVWVDFTAFCRQYTKNNNPWNAPIPVAHNLINFDLLIANRLCTQYGPSDSDGRQTLFHPTTMIDTIPMLFTWFENIKEPDKINLDFLRQFFGIKSDGKSHEALTDVQDLAKIFVRFMKLQRSIAPKVKFKDACAND